MATYIAVPEPKGELSNIAVQVLGAGMVIDAVNAPLEDRENALNSVRGDIAPDILASAVVDRFMLVEQPSNAVVDRAFVGVDRRADLNMAMGEANCIATGDRGPDLCLDPACLASSAITSAMVRWPG